MGAWWRLGMEMGANFNWLSYAPLVVVLGNAKFCRGSDTYSTKDT